MVDEHGNRRKLVIFSEFKDTLRYLVRRIRNRLGRDEPVVEIHGSVKRQERRKIIHSFMNDPETLILVANDAAARDAGLPAWEVEATLASAERTATGDDDELKRSVIRLAALPPHEYDRERQAEAKRLQVRVGTLDGAINAARAADEGGDLQGRPLEWPEPEPWPEPVDGSAMLAEIAEIIALHVSLPAALADAVALWTVMTWLHDRLDISPFLNVTSATKRCGNRC